MLSSIGPRPSHAPRLRILLVAAVLGAVGVTVLASACGSTSATTARDAGVPVEAQALANDAAEDASTDDAADAFDDWLAPPPLSRDAGESTLAPLRQSCAFGAGAWPAQTVGNDYPVGKDIPINHVIVIMQENRSFDHYLGRLVAQGYYQAGDFTVDPDSGAPVGSGFASSTQLDGPPPGWHVDDSDGGPVVPHPDDEYCFGAGHSWDDQHFDWDNGKNDGFVVRNDPDGQRTMFYEDDTVIPFYYALASTFSVGDRYFCSVISSTWPNRYFLLAGTSFGMGDNSFCTMDTLANPVPKIFTLLEEGGHSWMDYTDGPHMEQFFTGFGFSEDALAHYGNVKCDLFTAIQNSTLPDVSFVMGDEVTETTDEAPSSPPGIGGQLVEKLIRALWASDSWRDTVVFITYDENGGMADHVPPAPACEPDHYAAHDGTDASLSAPPGTTGFNTTGFRVPFLVVSPYAKAHFVSHTVHDHTSILRFIETRFGLPALTARDANSAPPMEMFDFQNPPFMTPPNVTLVDGGPATTTVPPAILTQCNESLAPVTCVNQ
jgi:phospholipase C